MEETIILKCDKTGRIAIKDGFPINKSKTIITKKFFSTPDSNGQRFGKLYADMKEGDIIEFTFKNIRICSQCGKQLEDPKK
jgi:uncharacterized protein with PIN domain